MIPNMNYSFNYVLIYASQDSRCSSRATPILLQRWRQIRHHLRGDKSDACSNRTGPTKRQMDRGGVSPAGLQALWPGRASRGIGPSSGAAIQIWAWSKNGKKEKEGFWINNVWCQMSILFMCFFFIDEIKIKKRSMIEAFSCLKGHRVLISIAVRLTSCIINRRDLFEPQISSGTSQQRLRIGTEGLLLMHFIIRRKFPIDTKQWNAALVCS